MFSKNSSGYFYKRDQSRFGSKQDDYLRQVNEIVIYATNLIKDTINEQKDLTELFDTILSFMGDMRHSIAVEHNTESAELYGIRRDEPPFSHFVMQTCLGGVYKEYNNQLISKMQSHLRPMRRTNKVFQQCTSKINGESCLGRRTSIDISILSKEKASEWVVEYTREYYEKLCNICEITPLDDNTHINVCFNSLMTIDVMKIIKEKSIEDYKRLKNIYVIKDIYSEFPGRKSDWALFTNRCEINGKMYALTQYLTWLYRTFRDDPVDYMTTREDPTVVCLIHQDVFLIKETLKDVGELFKQAIEWDSGDIQDLINQVGLINYLFAHSMPFARGSAAICEWLEM